MSTHGQTDGLALQKKDSRTCNEQTAASPERRRYLSQAALQTSASQQWKFWHAEAFTGLRLTEMQNPYAKRWNVSRRNNFLLRGRSPTSAISPQPAGFWTPSGGAFNSLRWRTNSDCLLVCARLSYLSKRLPSSSIISLLKPLTANYQGTDI